MALEAPAKPDFPDFDGDEYDPHKMRSFVRAVKLLSDRLRLNGTLIVGGGRAITKHLSATVAWNPPNLPAGTQTTQAVTVTGARLAAANTATCGFSVDLQGMQLSAYVSADDTVTVVLRNGTAGALDLAAGNLTVDVWRHG